MAKVKFTLDESGGFDPADPLGDLEIVGDDGKKLILNCTFIDVWLLSLIQSKVLSGHADAEILSVLEESFCLKVAIAEGMIELETESNKIYASKDSLIEELYSAAKKLVNFFINVDGFDKNTALVSLRDKVKTEENPNKGTYMDAP